MKGQLLTLVGTVFFFILNSSAAAEEPPELIQVRANFHKKITEKCSDLNASYFRELGQLKLDLGGQGLISEAETVQNEINSITSHFQQDHPGLPIELSPTQKDGNGQLPEKLTVARAKYRKSLSKIKPPIVKTYTDYLEGLLRTYGAAGNLASAKLVQKELNLFPGFGINSIGTNKPGTIVLWNQYNGSKGDRGTRRVNVILFSGDKEVWRKNGVNVSWSNRKDVKTEISVPGVGADRVLVEVTRYESKGGGLSEIQYLIDNKNIAEGKSTKASAYWEKNESYRPGCVTDGKTSSANEADGYWLLPNKTLGWIEVKLD